MPARKAPTPVALDETPVSVNMLVYGKSGIGKTVFGAGAGGADLVISCEKDKGASARRLGGKGKIIVCPDFETFLAAKQAWEDGEYGDPEWTLFDSLTSIQSKAIDWILSREFGKAAQGTRKLDVLQIQDHLEYQNLTRRLIGELCDNPRNVIMTAQDMNVDTDGGDESVLPALEGGKGKISNFVCGMMTCVGYMKIIEHGTENEKGTEVRRIYWQPRPPYFAKDWTDSLGKFTDNRTLAQISARINGAFNAEGESRPAPATATGGLSGAAARRAARAKK
jgi:hypothetical protein